SAPGGSTTSIISTTSATATSSSSNNYYGCKLSVVLELLRDFVDDKEVVRIACCLLHASVHWPSVAAALHERSTLDALARCACKHPAARAVVDCLAEFLRVLGSSARQ